QLSDQTAQLSSNSQGRFACRGRSRPPPERTSQTTLVILCVNRPRFSFLTPLIQNLSRVGFRVRSRSNTKSHQLSKAILLHLDQQLKRLRCQSPLHRLKFRNSSPQV